MDVEDRSRQRNALPPIGSLGHDRIKNEEASQHQKYPSMSELSISTAPVVSPAQTPRSGPPMPYSYSSANGSSGPPASGYISPPDSRRTTKDEGDQSGSRQSLPSISEALSDRSLAYPNHSQAPEAQLPSASTTPMPAPQPRSFLGGPQGPPNPFAQSSTSTPARSEPSFPSHTMSQGHHQPPDNPVSSGFQPVNGVEARPRPLQTYGLPRSPRTSSTSSFAGNSNRSPTLNSGYVSNSATSPTSLGSFRSPFSFNGHTLNQPSSLAPPNEQTRHFPPDWKFDNSQKYPPPTSAGPPHIENVKRTLDIYESEMAFNDLLDSSTILRKFADFYYTRSCQQPRTELSLDSLPNMNDIEDMMKHVQRLHTGLDRIRGSIILQEQVRAERAFKGHEEEMNGFHDDFKGGFAGNDAKKRRGKAAPPGRCHSCNRAETPEWRRGPDGARTLCNACGLHYAKLTRKVGANKASSISGSNLRPKNLEMS